MENASRALLMVGGILLGVLILALTVTLFASSKSLSNSYEATKQSETIQQFNVNFTKYLGQDLTIHQVVTICNFAKKNSVSVSNEKTIDNIKEDVNAYGDTEQGIATYTLTINSYSDEGYVNSITFNKNNNK